MTIRVHFLAGDFDTKVGQTDLVLARDHGSLVGPCMQDYTILCVHDVPPWLTFRHTHAFDKLSQLS